MTANRPVLGTRPMTSQQFPISVGHNHNFHCYFHPPLVLLAAQPHVRAPTAPEGRQHAYFTKVHKRIRRPPVASWETNLHRDKLNIPPMALICMHIQFCLFKSKGSGVALNL